MPGEESNLVAEQTSKIGAERAGSVYKVDALQSLSAGSGASVLVLVDADTAGTASLIDALGTNGFNVTVRNPPEFTWDGSNPSVDGFDCVVHLDGATYYAALPVSGQLALSTFVAEGGGYVGSQWLGYELSIGQQTAMNDLVLQRWADSATDNSGGRFIDYSVVAGQEGHPVLAGIPSSFNFFADGHDAGSQIAFASNPSTVLMRAPSGGPAVLVREHGSGHVVNFSFAANYPGTVQDGRTLQDPSIQALYVNALRWACAARNQAPVPVCEDLAVDADASCSACGSIDGGSFDPDGDAITLVQSPTCVTGVGATSVTLTATDVAGAGATCTARLTVADVTAPQATVAARQIMAFPRTCAMEDHSLADCIAQVTDNCDAALDIDALGSIVSITSDEDVITAGHDCSADPGSCIDIEILDHSHFQLRNTRDSFGNGRVYTVNFTLSDQAGNRSGEYSCKFAVRQWAQGNPVEGPPAYTVYP